MAKNYMKEVANLLGVELEEEFKIKGEDLEDYVYKFSSKCLLTKANGRDVWFESEFIYAFLNGTYEIEKTILNRKEKEYLSAVIKPFKDRVTGISKIPVNKDEEYIEIFVIKSEDEQVVEYINLPTFKKGIMYKGMELNKEYSLKELDLC